MRSSRSTRTPRRRVRRSSPAPPPPTAHARWTRWTRSPPPARRRCSAGTEPSGRTASGPPSSARAPRARRSEASAGRDPGGLGALTQQVALLDQLQREGPVAHRVEQHRHLVAVVALYDTLSPLPVLDACAAHERLRPVLGRPATGLAVVAVPAGPFVGLPEVRQNELAPAAVVLSVGAHHLEARAIERAPLLGRLHRALDLVRFDRERAHTAVRAELDRTRLLEPAERGRDLRIAQLELLAEPLRLDR